MHRLPAPQSRSSLHAEQRPSTNATQLRVAKSQTGLAPPQLMPSMQSTHPPTAGSHTIGAMHSSSAQGPVSIPTSDPASGRGPVRGTHTPSRQLSRLLHCAAPVQGAKHRPPKQIRSPEQATASSSSLASRHSGPVSRTSKTGRSSPQPDSARSATRNERWVDERGGVPRNIASSLPQHTRPGVFGVTPR